MSGGLEAQADAFACNMIEAYALEKGMAVLPSTIDDPLLQPIRSELKQWYLDNFRIFTDGGDTGLSEEALERLHAALTMYTVALDAKKNRKLLSFLGKNEGTGQAEAHKNGVTNSKYFYFALLSILAFLIVVYLFWGELKQLALEVICGVVFSIGDKQPGSGSMCFGIVVS